MVMVRPKGKALNVAEKVMKGKGIKIRKPKNQPQTVLTGPYLQH